VEGEVHIVTGAVTVAIGIMNRLCSYLRLLGDNVVSQLSTSLMRAETAQACPPQKPPW